MSFQKAIKFSMSILFMLSLVLPRIGEWSEFYIKSYEKKVFAPRFVINLFINGAITAFSFESDEKGGVADVNDAILMAAFFANSITPVILFQNYDSVKPFLQTIALTGGAAVVSGLLAIPLSDGSAGIVLLVNWFFGMPYIASKTNHKIYLDRIKNKQLNFNLLQPTYLSYNNKMVPGIQLIQLNW